MEIISFRYSIPYIIVVTLYLLLSLLTVSKRGKNRFSSHVRVLCVTLFVCFIGLRGFIGSDCYVYYYYFQKSSQLSVFSDTHYEPGFVILLKIFNGLGFSYSCYQFLMGLIIGSILDVFFRRYSTNYALAWLAFFAFGGLIIAVDLQRNIISMSLFMISLPFLWRKRLIPYLCLNIIGMFFHSSAILYIPFYFIAHRDIKRNMLIAIFIICNILFLTGNGILSLLMNTIGKGLGGDYYDIYLRYTLSYNFAKGISIGYIERTITFLLVYIFYNRILRFNTYNRMFVNMFLCYYIAYFLLADIEVIAQRISLLFKISYWILIPTLFYVMKYRNNRILYLTYLMIYSFIWTAFTTNNINFKYDNILTGSSSYEQRVSETNRRLIR